MTRPDHDELVVALAAYGLPGAAVRLPATADSDETWRRLRYGAVRHRLQGFLAAAVADGALAVGPREREEAAELHRQVMTHVLRLEHRLLEVVDVLAGAGIDHRILKGPAVARVAYPHRSLRVFGDIDILVPSEQLGAAVDSLLAAGHRRRQLSVNDAFDRRFGKGVSLVGDDGLEIDLHRTFTKAPLGLSVDTAALFSSATPVTVAGRTVQALAPEYLLLHTCYTVGVADTPPRPVAMRDLAQILLTVDFDEAEVRALAGRWNATAVVATAVATTWRTFALADVLPLCVWADGYVPSRAEGRVLSAYRRRGEAPTALVSLRTIPGAGAKLAFLRGLTVPDRQFLRARNRSYPAWMMQGIRGLFRPERTWR